jgi:hypothetical protein
MTLDGGGKALILGRRPRHRAFRRRQRRHVVRGLRLTGSGDSARQRRCRPAGRGRRPPRRGQRLDDVLFGIHLKQVNRSTVIRQPHHGKKLPRRACAATRLRLWNSRDNLVEGNRFDPRARPHLRQLPDNRIAGNRSTTAATACTSSSRRACTSRTTASRHRHRHRRALLARPGAARQPRRPRPDRRRRRHRVQGKRRRPGREQRDAALRGRPQADAPPNRRAS